MSRSCRKTILLALRKEAQQEKHPRQHVAQAAPKASQHNKPTPSARNKLWQQSYQEQLLPLATSTSLSSVGMGTESVHTASRLRAH